MESVPQETEFMVPNDQEKARLVIPDNLITLSVRKSSRRSSEWGEYSCCRRGMNIQSRERMLSARVLEIQKLDCSDNYCDSCENDRPTCELFNRQLRACRSGSDYRTFMSSHCPVTCGMCAIEPPATASSQRPTTIHTTTGSTTPQASTPDPNLVQVQIYYVDGRPAHLYMYSTSQSSPTLPWKPVSRSFYAGEVTSFQMYSRPTGAYNTRFYFCKARHGRLNKWMI
uniref:ShKT domain-containing protein n=1 Tax=Ciona savignyi TaxID=51511 RepID=H2Z348_CIOSA